MSDLFKEKAADWDMDKMKQQLSSDIGAAILQHVELNENMQVMDFGAGTGLLTGHVLPRVKHITAVDISASMLDKLIAKPEFHGKVSALCQDITNEPLTGQYDLIISAMALHHVKDTNQLIQSFADHLLPGGMIALADLDKEDGTFHPADVEGVFHHGFERNALQVILESKGFSNVQFYTAHTVAKPEKSYPVFLVSARQK